jgi:hypothetical protein
MSTLGAPAPPPVAVATRRRIPPPPPPVAASRSTNSEASAARPTPATARDRVHTSRRFGGGKHLNDRRSILGFMHPATVIPLLIVALVLGIAIGRAGTSRSAGVSRDGFARVLQVMEILLSETSGTEKTLQEIRQRLAKQDRGDRSPAGPKGQARRNAREHASRKPNDRPGTRGSSDRKDRRGTPRVIATYKGDRPRSVPLFTVQKPWRVIWSGDDVFFFIRAKDGRLIHGDGGSGTGSYIVNRSGRFYFEVVASADWTLKVERA